MNVNDYIANETKRQSGTMAEAAGMGRAYEYLLTTRSVIETFGWHEDDLLNLVYLINGVREYRRVPAVFNQGQPAIDHTLIPNCMKVLVDYINDPVDNNEIKANFVAKEFLEIHPFSDGNGRVASLLWNFLNGTIRSPKPMPYFFGENNG